ncbi:MAG: cupin-like domain-containing protein [Asticcacaulis sp.]|uniref:cupin-like domain-containing protein n=1 Tax=Asticcacaulis sp. TaxID=1872648 RepID=UPI0039E5B084
MDFPSVDIRHDVRPGEAVALLAGQETPLILKGLVNDWPAVAVARRSTSELIAYLKACDAGIPAETFRQAPGGDGKYFYGDLPQKGRNGGFNFQRAPLPLAVTLDRLNALRGKPEAEHIYIQSAPLKDFLPRFKAENPLDVPGAEPRIWIGNRSVTQTHFDINYNLACLVAGRKRFVLFPPAQTANLYMGPLEATVSGVPTAMASLENPDFEAHPRFREALGNAVVADLAPGDALYVPYMWWHHVSSSEDLNVQVNYWWNTAGAEMGAPMQVLMLAMLGLRDLPADQKRAWKAMFEHLVFSGERGGHLAPEVRGIQGNITPEQRRAIRRAIGQNLQD